MDWIHKEKHAFNVIGYSLYLLVRPPGIPLPFWQWHYVSICRGKPYDGYPKKSNDWGYKAFRQEVYERDGYRCVYCNATQGLTLDHLVPQSRGGIHEVSNLVTACRSCNSKKNAKTPEEWLNETP